MRSRDVPGRRFPDVRRFHGTRPEDASRQLPAQMIGVCLAPEALHELSAAAAWYESKREGLGTELLNEVEEVLPRIAAMPESFPRLLDIPDDLEIRRALLPRFPYALVFLRVLECPGHCGSSHQATPGLLAEPRALASSHTYSRPRNDRPSSSSSRAFLSMSSAEVAIG